MTYQEIIQSVGKQIEKQVYYYDDNDTRVDVDIDNIEEIKIAFNCELTGTLMKSVDIILKEKLEITKPLYVDIVATYEEETATQTYGPYYLYETTYNADDKTYTHKCYDYILKTMVDYEPISITYPCTLQNYYNKLIETLGLTSSVSLINGSNTLASDIFDGINYTYRSVLQDIAQANGILLYVNGTVVNTVEITTTKSRSGVATITDDILKNSNIDFGEHYGPINVITLSRSGDSDNIYYPETLPSEIHEYKISDNQLLNDNDRSNYIENIYDKLNGIEFDLFDTELVGYGGFEPLQQVKFTTGGNTYTSYVFNNEIDITAGYNETIYTDLPSDTTTDYTAADTTDQRLNQTYLIVDKQNQKISGVISEVGEQNEKISQVELSIDELNTKIGEIADITTSGETSYATLDLTDVNESEPIHIRIFPTNENISYLYPSNGLYPSDDLYLKVRTLRFTNTKTSEYIDYVLPDDLLYVDSNTYDEFILDYETQTCQKIKRCEYDEDGNVYALSTSETITYDYPTISLTDGNYTITLLGYKNGYLSVRLMASNIYTSQFATKVELNSSIKQTKNEIAAEVSENYYDKDESDESYKQLSSKIDLTASSITAQVKQVSDDVDTVEGEVALKLDKDDSDTLISTFNVNTNQVIINSNNFKLAKDGTITATNGNFVNGTVTLSDTGSSTTTPKVKVTSSSDSSMYSTLTSYALTMKTSTSTTSVRSNNISMATSNNDIALDSYNGSISVNSGSSNNASINTSSGGSLTLNSSSGTGGLNPTRMYVINNSGVGYGVTQANGLVSYSDRTLKENIEYIDSEKSKEIIKDLKPVNFKYIGADNYHRGLIAQEVIETLNNNGIENEIYSQNENGKYQLSYEEFIADLIGCNKYLINKVEELETRIKELENER